jgi:hypothetical protein
MGSLGHIPLTADCGCTVHSNRKSSARVVLATINWQAQERRYDLSVGSSPRRLCASKTKTRSQDATDGKATDEKSDGVR